MSVHAPAASTITLQQLLALGTQNRAWAFVPVARQALRQTGSDPELWFLLASNLADLGLKTLASEELTALCQRRRQAEHLPHVAELRARIASLPDDRVPTEALVAHAESARSALADRGLDLQGEFDRWRVRIHAAQHFRAGDGNIVRLWKGELAHLGDQIGASSQIGKDHIAKATESPAPFTVEGVDPPWLLIELARQTPPLDSGYQPGIRVVQADTGEFFDGCAMADLAEILRHPRVECFVGQDAAQRLRSALSRDAGTPIAGPYMPLRSLRKPCAPGVSEIVRAELANQDAAHREHLRRIHQRDAERDERWWRARLAGALDASAEPLRILIATCRFTTVLGEMSQDLAGSLRSLGCRVEVLVEPSDHRRLSPLAYSRMIDTFDPDVILAPNYTRRDLEKVISGSHTPPPESRVLPAGTPFVVWVQDAMPHLLTTGAGASIGPLDLAMGCITNEMTDRFGYPVESVLPSPLVASQAKFDPARIDPRLRRELSCDVAMITHHAETPEALRERLLGELSSSPGVRRLAESMLPAFDEIARTSAAPPGPIVGVRRLFEAHAHLDPETREILIQSFALRYIDRVMRHETAGWCADICQRRGWRFRIFGRNWASHPTLGRFASPSLPHGGSLACAYAGAGVTLHVSIFGSFHQRLIECALAGGVPIIRRTHDTERVAYRMAMRRAIRDLAPLGATADIEQRPGTLCYDHFASLDTHRLLAWSRRLGLPIESVARVPDPAFHTPPMTLAPFLLEAEAGWLMGDLLETSFDSETSLEGVIERARSYPNWRASLASGIAGRARQHFTHDALARRLLDALRSR